ncbi:MAG: non-hydrolyzing UDP-N-acetylglucosamine 2-epimerase [Candidatus Thorarchaeota archaeon]
MIITVVTGTRPQIIKSAPLLHELENRGLQVNFIHTGQHYDYELAEQFVEEFAIKEPDVNLGVGSGTGVYQTTEILTRLSNALSSIETDYMIVPGDTNSALGAALTGFKMEIPTCHLESGLRSFDMEMQEEINRRLIDHGCAALFAPTDTAVKNLEDENVRGSIYQVGDTMYDILKNKLKEFTNKTFQNEVLDEIGAPEGEFAVLTLHRKENVDVPTRLKGIIEGLGRLEQTIILPIHPRTKQRLDDMNLELSSNVITIPPIPYVKMMAMVSRSSLLMTDSGGLQKEAYLLDTPCVTIRDNSEWVETFTAGANVLAAPNPDDIIQKTNQMWGKKLTNDPSVYGDGKASKKITDILLSREIRIKSNLMLS